ncbi:hypothetical protein SLEP1_g24764 [Rubroshorea leprosula]|uniref:Uncharacterized protein n=1 Tax=Rubroshorea leprosula TaxID=152421 RepID=A0AAV5JQF6_9ROSI|nr:hypothetical protein SLEP1_g24764 [Rubroshorea leprosula]
MMDFSSFKMDIDELIDEFVKGESTTLADMKKVWLSRKFSYIFEASPSNNLAFFMQSLYAHTIGHICNTDSLSVRLGGLYCLYCLYETQPFKPPFKIYISLGELEKLRVLVADAKAKYIKAVPSLVNRMLETNMFLFGFVDINKGSDSETVKQLTEFQNTCIKVANDRLFKNSNIEHYLHMDLGREVDLDLLKQMSAEYAEAKKQAIEAASEVVDVQNIEHISDSKECLGDIMENVVENWNVQKEAFCEQTGLNQQNDDGFDELYQLLEQSDE